MVMHTGVLFELFVFFVAGFWQVQLAYMFPLERAREQGHARMHMSVHTGYLRAPRRRRSDVDVDDGRPGGFASRRLSPMKR